MKNFIFALITGFLFCAQASATDRIRVSVTNYNMSYLAAGVAAKRGFFKEEGLDVEIVRMNANVAMSSLISGDVDYTMIFASVIRAAMRGIPLKVIAVLIDSPPYAFIARPEITAMKALKGKTVGIGVYGSSNDIIARMMLERSGIDPGTTNKKLKENAQEVVRVIRAFIKANRFVRDNRQETINVLADWGRTQKEDAIASYDSTWQVFSPDGAMPDDGMRLVLDDAQKALKATRAFVINEVADVGPLREAQRTL